MTNVKDVALFVRNTELAPVGIPVDESVTAPLNPLLGVMLTGIVPPVPRASVKLALVEMENPGIPAGFTTMIWPTFAAAA